MTDIERFMAKVEPELNSGCWLWAGGLTSDGYGVAQHRKKSLLAHRVSYELFNGSAPSRALVCHRCDIRSCVNPVHLFVGTQADNMADMRLKGRASRKHGSQNGRAVLNEVAAREVSDLLKTGAFSAREIARSYGVSDSTVSRIKHGLCFRNIDLSQPN